MAEPLRSGLCFIVNAATKAALDWDGSNTTGRGWYVIYYWWYLDWLTDRDWQMDLDSCHTWLLSPYHFTCKLICNLTCTCTCKWILIVNLDMNLITHNHFFHPFQPATLGTFTWECVYHQKPQKQILTSSTISISVYSADWGSFEHGSVEINRSMLL